MRSGRLLRHGGQTLGVLVAVVGLLGSVVATAAPALSETIASPLVAGPALGLVVPRGGIAASGAAASRLSGSPLMTFHGGKIMPTAKTTAIFWGPSWSNSSFVGDKITGLDSFYAGHGNSNYAKTVDEYTGTNGQVGAATTYSGHLIDTSNASGGGSTSGILAEVARRITNPDPNGYYPVYTDVPRGNAGYCAYHSSGTIGGVTVQFAFFWKLDGDPGCDPGDTQTGHSQGLAALANVSGHELSEARSDPGTPAAWYDSAGQENGDKCAWTFNVPSVAFSNGSSWKVQGEWSNAADKASTGYPNSSGQKGCLDGATKNVSVTASPNTVTVGSGATATSTINTSGGGGAAGTIDLSVSGAPPGVTATLNPTSVPVGGSSTLTVTQSSSSSSSSSLTTGAPRSFATAADATAALTVTGTLGTETESTSVALTTTSSTTDDFSVTATPTSLFANQGDSVTSSIATAVVSGSSSTVDLTVNGVPPGATASLSPASLAAGNTSTLTFNGGTAEPGNYFLSVSGTEGSATHATEVTVNVSSLPTITSADNATFPAGTLSSFTVTSTGFPVASLSESGPLPAGVGFVDNRNGTATLAGSPVAGSNGVYPITIAADSTAGEAIQNFTLVVNQTATHLVAAPASRLNPTFSAKLTRLSDGAPLANQKVTFSISGFDVCSATTNTTGVATCHTLGIVLGPSSYGARFAGDATYLPATATGPFT
jgi:hypothetical protein